MALTIKNLADELGVSKTAIRKHMDDAFREEFTIKDGNKILIKEAGAEELKNQFANQPETNEETENDVVTDLDEKDEEDVAPVQTATHKSTEFEILASQLTTQADQLVAKDQQIADLHKLLNQSQQLQLDVQSKLNKIENSQPTEQIETSVATEEAKAPKKRHWWNF